MEKKEVSYEPPKCPDCELVLNIPYDTQKGEVYSCPGCGLELEVKDIKKDGNKITYCDLQELVIEGEDWGE
jgi:uncharacterized paraquat-inducible protein A